MPPVVPYQREVELRPSDRQGIDVQSTPDMFGAAQARGMGQIARGLDSAANAFDAVRDLDDTNSAKSALTAYQRDGGNLQYGENGYLTKQGQSAVDGYKGYQDDDEKLRQKYAEGLSGNAKTKFLEASQALQTQRFQAGIVHQAQERKQWTIGETDSRLQSFTNDAAVNYNNPKQRDFFMAGGLAELDSAGKLQGWSPEQLKLKKDTFLSGIHSNVVKRFLQDGKSSEAIQYFDANKGAISANDQYELGAIIKPAQQAAAATTETDKILGGTNGSAPITASPTQRGVGMPPPTTISRRFVPRDPASPFAFMVTQVENQAQDPGAVSTAGAQGLAQVMPKTAREVATKMGRSDIAQMNDAQLREHFKNNPDDNLAIGEEYFSQMRAKYGDDKAAVIAYNAGPKVADVWIKAGRDDSSLPRETYNYVGKVFGEEQPARRRGRGGQLNDTMPQPRRAATIAGADAYRFLSGRSNHGNSVRGLQEDFAANLAAMIQDAPPEIRDGITLTSDYRDSGVQAANFAKSDGSGKMVARPGGSSHEYGLAADLGWKGGGIRSMPENAKKWLHDNARAYGLNFRMSWEDWHIEPIDARQRIASGAAGEPSAAGTRANLMAGGEPNYRNLPATGQVVAGRDGMSYRSRMPSYDQIEQGLSQISDPTVREQTRKLINSRLASAAAADEADHRQAKQQLWNWVDAGNTVASVPPDLRSRLAMEDMSAAFNYEEARAKGPTINDDQNLVYNMRRFAAADPATFAGVDLMQYRDRISQQTMKELTDTQTKYISDPASAQKDGVEIDAAMKQAEPYIQAMGYGSQGKSGTELQEAKKQEIQARLALMQQIQAYKAANNGRSPTYMDVENMLQTLSRPVVFQNAQGGKVEAGILGGVPNRFVFQGRNRPDGSFMVGTSTYEQIPTDLRRHITDRLATRLGRQPSQVEVAAAYNDFTSRENPGANPADYPQNGPPIPSAPAGVQPQVPAPAAAPPGVVPPPQATGAEGPAPAVYPGQEQAPVVQPQPEPFIMSTSIGQDTGPKDQSRVPEGQPNLQPGSQEEADAIQRMVDDTSARAREAERQKAAETFTDEELAGVRAALENARPRAVIRESDVKAEAKRLREAGKL